MNPIQKSLLTTAFEALGPERVTRGLTATGHSWRDCFLSLAMYGEPRETRDADFAVTGVDIERARLALADLGVDVVIAFSDVRFGGCDVSRLSLVGGSQVNTVDLDAGEYKLLLTQVDGKAHGVTVKILPAPPKEESAESHLSISTAGLKPGAYEIRFWGVTEVGETAIGQSKFRIRE